MAKPRVSDEDIKLFKKMLDTGLSRGEVAKKLGLSKSMVARYTGGYKPKISARAVLREKTRVKYAKIAKMCLNMSMQEVADAVGEEYNTVTKACRMFPELCHNSDEDISLNADFIDDVKKELRRGLDEYEIISCLNHKYRNIKKSDIKKVRRLMPAPRIGFMGMQV